MIKLHNFQTQIANSIRKAISEGHKRILVQSPTGSGKTVIFSSIVYNANIKDRKCLILTDRIELLTGTDGTLAKFGIGTHSILSGQKYPPKQYGHCIAMSQTLRLRLDIKEWINFIRSFSIVIIDEAHIQEFNIYFEKDIFTSGMFILGFTATPKRLKKQRQLHLDYTKLIIGPQVPKLIKMGFLVKDNYYAPRHFDVSDLKLNSFGDYKESDMFSKFNKNTLYHGVIKNWNNICKDTITLVFCVNIAHVVKTTIAFNEAGISAKFIVSNIARPYYYEEMTDAQFIKFKKKKEEYQEYLYAMNLYSGERETVIQEWKEGKFKVLINAGIYTKGFDHKPIETIIINRATTSESLWLQMIGRGSRISENKQSFNILDFGSNAERLGLYSQEREWSLYGKTSSAEGVAPVKECGIINGKQKMDSNHNNGCGALILASKMICDYCGYIFEKEKFEIEVDLIKIEYDDSDDSEYGKISFSKLERQAEERGYKFGWVINRIIAEGGVDALHAFKTYKGYKNEWVHRMEKHYSNAIKLYNDKNMQDKVLSEQDEEKLLF